MTKRKATRKTAEPGGDVVPDLAAGPGGYTPGQAPDPPRDHHADRVATAHAPGPDLDSATDGADPGIVTVVDGQPRWRVTVQARKIPAAERDVIRPLLPNNAALAERGFVDGLGADTDDDDPTHPVGSTVFYEIEATASEINAMRAASNAVSVQVTPIVTVLR